MSRIGGKIIVLVDDVSVESSPRNIVVNGKLGSLSFDLPNQIKIEKDERTLKVLVNGTDSKEAASLQGLYRSLVSNAVIGVSSGFSNTLELVGIGYRAQMKGSELVLSLGFSHPINFSVPEGITITVEGTNKITVKGIDKQLVGQVCANIRSFRPPEPYKGKGVRYSGERVILKAGKSAKK